MNSYDKYVIQNCSTQLEQFIELYEDDKLLEKSTLESFLDLWLEQQINEEFFQDVLDKSIHLYSLIYGPSYKVIEDCDFDTYPFTPLLIIEALNNSTYEQAKKDLFNDSLRILIYESKNWG